MKMIGVFLTTLVFVSIAYGGDNYTICGDVGFRYDGDIYICLLTSEKFAESPERYCQMLCTALGSDPVYFDTVNKLYSFNYHC